VGVVVAKRFYFAVVDISPAVATKIQSKHGVTPDEAREACGGYQQARWTYSDDRGLRLSVVGVTASGRRLKLILQPVDEGDGVWRLRTAMPATR
jgi:hypothetical protein